MVTGRRSERWRARRSGGGAQTRSGNRGNRVASDLLSIAWRQQNGWQNCVSGHIGRMARAASNQPGIIALLSAVSSGNADKSAGPAIVDDTSSAGNRCLNIRYRRYERQGVSRFLLEVDSVAGSLLELADRLRAKGCNIEFVRSTADLQKAVGRNDVLFVQTEAVFLSAGLLRIDARRKKCSVYRHGGWSRRECRLSSGWI